MVLILPCLLLALSTQIGAYKILLLTVPVSKGSKSQLDLMAHLGETLAQKGHKVTIIMQGEQTINSTLLEQDRCPSAVNKTYSRWFGEELKKVAPNMLRGQALNRDNVRMFGSVFLQECHKQLGNTELIRKHKRKGFDLAIIDHIHICGYLYARKLGIKYVTLEFSSYMTLLADSLTPCPLSYVPVFTSRLTDQMTFVGRLKNTVMAVFLKFFIISIITSPYDEIKEKFRIEPALSVQQLRMESELWLINSDLATEFPRPLMPNTKLVGGMLLTPPKSLEQDLEDFIAGAGSAGVVVVCFGSALDLSHMPDMVDMFFTALGALPQRVIWGSKFTPKKVPENFMFTPWIPQQDLLGHPSTKAFITHGGINSLLEAVYHAVPTFVIPSTADAFDNVLRLEKKGVLLWRPYMDMTYETLRSDVISLVNDKKYKTKAQWLSSIFKDQPLKPDERAAFWVEHILKHGGGRHLRSAAFDLSLYQYYMLDVILFIMMSSVTFVISLLCCCRMCFRRFKSLFPAHRQPEKTREDIPDEDHCSGPHGNDHYFEPAPQQNVHHNYHQHPHKRNLHSCHDHKD